MQPAIRRSDALLCSISFALSAVMLSPMSARSFLIHFHAKSGAGKSQILHLTRSLFGDPSQLPNWNSSVTAFDEVLSQSADIFFPCDELTYLDGLPEAAKNLRRVTYTIDSNTTRRISERSANFHLKTERRGRTIVMSNGEISLAELYARHNEARRLGEKRRALDIALRLDPDTGIFGSLPNGQTSYSFYQRLDRVSRANFGHAGYRFVSRLAKDKDAWMERATAAVADFLQYVDVPSTSSEDEHARRFGLAYAAALEAQKAEILKCSQKRLRRVLAEFYQKSRDTQESQAQPTIAVLKVLRRQLRKDSQIVPFDSAEQHSNAQALGFHRRDDNALLIKTKRFKTLCAKSGAKWRDVVKELRSGGNLIVGRREPAIQQVSGAGGRKGRRRYLMLKYSFARGATSKRGIR